MTDIDALALQELRETLEEVVEGVVSPVELDERDAALLISVLDERDAQIDRAKCIGRGAMWFTFHEDGRVDTQALADPGTVAEHYVGNVLEAWIQVVTGGKGPESMEGSMAEALRERLMPARGAEGDER